MYVVVVVVVVVVNVVVFVSVSSCRTLLLLITIAIAIAPFTPILICVQFVEMSHVSIAESLTTQLLLRNSSRVVKLSAIET
jgi:hypothetical protein